MKLENRQEDVYTDQLGNIIFRFSQIEKWNREKHSMFDSILDKAMELGYLAFSGDRRTYSLQRTGESCIFFAPLKQRGALAEFAGNRVRVICVGRRDGQSGRFYLVGSVNNQI